MQSISFPHKATYMKYHYDNFAIHLTKWWTEEMVQKHSLTMKPWFCHEGGKRQAGQYSNLFLDENSASLGKNILPYWEKDFAFANSK